MNKMKSKEDNDIKGINRLLNDEIKILKSKQDGDIKGVKSESERREKEF